MSQLILASSSPRRKELLEQVHIPFQTKKQDADESSLPFYNPRAYVQALAELKNRTVELQKHNEVILSADTIVSFEGKVLGKPQSAEEAYEMLSMLSGAQHEVYTGVMLRSSEQESFIVEKTTVEFWPLTKDEIEYYIETGDPFDKAGGYGIQTYGATLVKGIKGDYNNVVGLPLSRVVRSLQAYGVYPSLPEVENERTGN
ncbi:septum formation inhibitor Maf [Pontibacillus sp. ALD_SL1]|uniref:Maf family protein n=1 Tax=Pontibacillus sp. ALD_SL1 TaxID=2777185 RepID=UPI001A972A90|nr:Maf family protein [Pontibacillus sp. ALD_SL1]QSS99107.1 septum formation inhibitor Maf [Pontibacillus sp. ALD_SL1]